jgi:hypothetical protein
MSTAMTNRRYRSTESKYKVGAQEMYVTYDLDQKTRGGRSALYRKVKRVYIVGEVKDWKPGLVRKRTGVKCTVSRSNMSGPVRAIVREGTRPGGRDEISRCTKDRRCDCSAVCPGGRDTDRRSQRTFL